MTSPPAWLTQTKTCPLCHESSLRSTGAFWICAFCRIALTTQALWKEEHRDQPPKKSHADRRRSQPVRVRHEMPEMGICEFSHVYHETTQGEP